MSELILFLTKDLCSNDAGFRLLGRFDEWKYTYGSFWPTEPSTCILCPIPSLSKLHKFPGSKGYLPHPSVLEMQLKHAYFSIHAYSSTAESSKISMGNNNFISFLFLHPMFALTSLYSLFSPASFTLEIDRFYTYSRKSSKKIKYRYMRHIQLLAVKIYFGVI